MNRRQRMLRHYALSGLASPAEIPEVAAGFWWDSELYNNLGSAPFKWTERNLNSAWNQLQTTVALQPGQTTSNDRTLFRYRVAPDPSPSVTSTAAANAAGWTGATYIAGWFGFPLGITSTCTLFSHSGTAGSRRIQAQRSATQYLLVLSSDGTAETTYAWDVASETDLHFCEWIFDPSASATDRGKFAVDRVAATASIAPSGPATIVDASASAQICNSGAANANISHVGMVYYCNGIPSDAHRDFLYSYKAPVVLP